MTFLYIRLRSVYFKLCNYGNCFNAIIQAITLLLNKQSVMSFSIQFQIKFKNMQLKSRKKYKNLLLIMFSH